MHIFCMDFQLLPTTRFKKNKKTNGMNINRVSHQKSEVQKESNVTLIYLPLGHPTATCQAF